MSNHTPALPGLPPSLLCSKCGKKVWKHMLLDHEWVCEDCVGDRWGDVQATLRCVADPALATAALKKSEGVG